MNRSDEEYQNYLEKSGLIKKTKAVIEEILGNVAKMRGSDEERELLFFISPDSYGHEETIYVSMNGSPPKARIIIFGIPDGLKKDRLFEIERYVIFAGHKTKTVITNLHGGKEKKKIIDYDILHTIPNVVIMFFPNRQSSLVKDILKGVDIST